jgi:hypothetical protein
VIPPGRWLSIEGELSSDDFRARLSKMPAKFGGRYDVRKYFCEENELFRAGGRTYALTNQWGLGILSQLDELIAMLPSGAVAYTKAGD